MVESFQPGMRFEALIRVALFAIGAQVVVVRILVATVAIAERYPGKALKSLAVFCFFFVAFDAADGSVFALEREIRFRVVKIGCGLECCGVVAFRTIAGKRFLVIVGVASRTVFINAEVGIAPFFQIPVADVVGFVALPAIDGFVFAGQFVSGTAVVEFVFIKTNNGKIPAMVVAVARDAFLALHFAGCVKPHTPVEPVFDLTVTTQAFVVGYLVAQYVALRAIGYAFQTRVHFCQRAGRNLGPHPASKEEHPKGNMQKTGFQI